MGKTGTNLEDLNQIIKNLGEALQETQKSLQETQKSMQETQKSMEREQEKTQKSLQETQKSMEREREKTQKSLQETQKSMEKEQEKTQKSMEREKTEKGMRRLEAALNQQTKNLDKVSGDFTRKWGAFMEKLVEGQLVDMLQKAKIPVNAITKKYEITDKKGKNILAEFDLLAINGNEMVVVEVKTTLTNEKLIRFIDKTEEIQTPSAPDKNGESLWCRGLLEL